MDEWATTAVCLGPMAIFFVVVVLRVVADAQPESPWSGPRRTVLILACYTLIGIGFVSLVFATLLTGFPGGVMLLLFTIATMQILSLEARIAGKRNQARQAELLWLLATTIRNGGNLADDLELYARGCWGTRHHRLISLAQRIRKGTPLTEIVIPQGLLPATATLEIQAGLNSGHLAEALRDAARRQTREMADDSLSAKLETALSYPLAILAATVLVVGFVMYYIIPKFKKIFDDFGTELPDMTRSLIHTSDAFVNYWYLGSPLFYVALAIAVSIEFAGYYGWRTLSQRLFGRWFARTYTPDLLRSLSHSVASDLTLNQALEAILWASGMAPLRRRISAVHTSIQQGAPCWQELRRFGFLRRCEVTLLESAQTARNLPWTLLAIADAIERRWSYRLLSLTELVSPLVILIPGIVVAYVVIGLFMPLVKLLHDLS